MPERRGRDRPGPPGARPASREAGSAESPRRGRVLGLDLGGSRIGVAISDPDRKVAVPLGTVRTGAPEDVRAIAALVREHGVVEVVVGHPLSLRGDAGEGARLAERFAEALRGVLGLPVHLQDERLTTAEAERRLAAAGVRGPARREVVDRSAAALILQAFLDRRAAAGPAPPDP